MNAAWLWLGLVVVVVGLHWLVSRQQTKRRLPLRAKRSVEEEALRNAVTDWLSLPGIRRALVQEGFDRSEYAIMRCVGDLDQLTGAGVHDLAERILEHRRVRHLIARRLMVVSGASQFEAKKALRDLAGIDA